MNNSGVYVSPKIQYPPIAIEMNNIASKIIEILATLFIHLKVGAFKDSLN
jgi:hypothetical protein